MLYNLKALTVKKHASRKHWTHALEYSMYLNDEIKNNLT